ncbi:DUF962 domain-containing protein [Aliiglaciecola sp. CAU 1673]|uniref:DUF962 domain-containing protein n=1 Tax=Aliiglaciecola sp. CAU 1673 TaxID=3032595 RepID=UPI0023DA5DBF|nr:DUF962 domain-containing protein [Aliiglaciecola sp. CAU 1673]MDF2179634.1 DUF962 domain-containing protein [Aliiglaciecola sp. CAU 1673]
MAKARFTSFAEFYPYYLQEHRDSRCRRLHYLGSTLVLLVLAFALFTGQFVWLWLMPLVGYGCAWLGHFFFEHNKPATFSYPFYSFLGDWVMLKDACKSALGRKTPLDQLTAQEKV